MVSRPKQAGFAGGALALIAAVIAVEGGYIWHKNDPGGETNMGVTKAVAVKYGYTGPMRTLPREVAESIYYDRYLVDPGYEPLIALDAAVTEELFDTTVNMGPARPSRWFQQSINDNCPKKVVVDGRVGPRTVATFADCQMAVGRTQFCLNMLGSMDAKQFAEYGRLVRVNPKLRVFYKGWTRHRIGNVDRARCSQNDN